MKRILCMGFILFLALGATACAAPVAEQPPSPPADAVIFADPVLEAKVREALGKTGGYISMAEAEGITELLLRNDWTAQEDERILDISALAYFPNLFKLELTFNAISDISVLSKLTQLKFLDLGGNQVGDITPLAGLTKLEALTLFGNGLTDIQALCGLTNLDSLFIHANQIVDISPLANMTRLSLLMAQDNQISDISPLAGLALTRLYLGNNPIADYSPIADIYESLAEKDFEILSAGSVPDEPLAFNDPAFEKALRDAMGIHDRPVTQKDAFLTQALVIHNDKSPNSQFSDIGPLAYFVNLKSLEFNCNYISDLTPLAGLSKLSSLNIGFNQVADVSPLAGLTQLEQLKLNHNQIRDVSPLAGLTRLRELWLKENPIEDYSPLSGIYQSLAGKDFELQ